MNKGEIVRLKRPFRPTPDAPDYQFGIVVGTAQRDLGAAQTSEPVEIVLHLYEPQTSSMFIDEFGAPVMYSFDLDEVELLR